jgi:inhibitor of the pro-sigma K processing machinery
MGIGEILAYILALALMLILCRIFIKPLKSLFLLFLNSLLGGIGLFVFNYIFAGIGFSIGINIVTATTVGVLGFPGLVLLVLLRLVFGS